MPSAELEPQGRDQPPPSRPISVRWTIGDVHPRGFEALRLSLMGAWAVFGGTATYTVCVNTIEPEDAHGRTGDLSLPIVWRAVTRDDIPPCVRSRIGRNMAEGMAWKLAPLRVHTDRHELALDNDCIIWALPEAMRRWLAVDSASLLAEDVRCAFGQFGDELLEPRNCGMVGLPPGFDYEVALSETLQRRPVVLSSELDEQGLQTAALNRATNCLAVPTRDVSICTPFHPGTCHFGLCGAHFIGLNARHIPWDYYGRPADKWIEDHWERSRPLLERLVAVPEPNQALVEAMKRRQALTA